MNPNESKWIPMDPNGSQWIPIDPNGSKWTQMDPNGSQWIPTDPNGSQPALWNKIIYKWRHFILTQKKTSFKLKNSGASLTNIKIC